MNNLKYEIENALLEKRRLITNIEIELSKIKQLRDSDYSNKRMLIEAGYNEIEKMNEELNHNETHLRNCLNAIPR